MKSLSGVTLNINANTAFVIFPQENLLKRREQRRQVHSNGKSSNDMLINCEKYAYGMISRRDLVNSLADYLEMHNASD